MRIDLTCLDNSGQFGGKGTSWKLPNTHVLMFIEKQILFMIFFVKIIEQAMVVIDVWWNTLENTLFSLIFDEHHPKTLYFIVFYAKPLKHMVFLLF